MNLYLDIETVPSQRPDVIAEISESKRAELDASIAAIKPPGTHKKEETIVAWWENEAPKIVDNLKAGFAASVEAEYRKTGLDGAFGQVCVIGAAFNDEAPITLWQADYLDERQILEDFGCLMVDRIRAAENFSTLVIGHNVVAFDLRFLVQRHIINGVRPHMVIGRAALAKAWETEKVFDTMTQWAGVGNRIKLDKLCKALSIPTPKGDIDGSKVWDAVQAGRIAEVADYCGRDVMATRAIHKRLTFQPAYQPESLELDYT